MSRFLRAAAMLAALVMLAALPTTQALATHGQPDQGVPFHYSFISTDSYGPPTCDGAAWQFFSSGTADVSHLGSSTIEVSHCTWLDLPTTGHFASGVQEFTAANGDTLFLAYEGTFETVVSPDGFFSYIDLEWEVSGGSGRFEGATGSGHADVVSDIVAGTSSGTYAGTIAYDASN